MVDSVHTVVGYVKGLELFEILILILYLIFLSLNNDESNRDIVKAEDIPSEEVDPGLFPDLELKTIEEAVAEANDQLSNMEHGNIHTIDLEDDYFFGRLIRNYEMGDVFYWDFGDSETDVSIDAYSKEIIKYLYYEWFDGALSQSEAENNAIIIAGQFAEFPPSSYSGPSTDFLGVSSYYEYNASTNTTSFNEQNYWLLRYNRTKNEESSSKDSGSKDLEDQINTEDHIEVWLNLNGDLSYYYKNWNMLLDDFPTNYLVTQQEAEATALDAAGEGSSVDFSFKNIIRPNRYWTEEGNSYGESPSLAWEVWVTDSEDMLLIFHISGIENVIIGGDGP